MTVPLSEVFFPSVVVCNINQVRKSFFEELGIYDNETFIRQIYYDYIEGKSKNKKQQQKEDLGPGQSEQKIAVHEKILTEYLARMNKTTEGEQSINWVTHQKCKDMFILGKVRTMNYDIISYFSYFQSKCNHLEANKNRNNSLVSNYYNKLKFPALFSTRNRWKKSERDFNLL